MKKFLGTAHGLTACGTVTRSAWMPPTKVAYAHRAKAVSGNQAFWATRG